MFYFLQYIFSIYVERSSASYFKVMIVDFLDILSDIAAHYEMSCVHELENKNTLSQRGLTF